MKVWASRNEGKAPPFSDNAGTPIWPEHLPCLFDRFCRVDKSCAHLSADGTGLGLAITRANMEALGGMAPAESKTETHAVQPSLFCKPNRMIRLKASELGSL